ncbi:MAG: transcription-repair-coupling factor [Candidatus Binatia bacterium]|nr:MAG: transcription-repair-coupling factor [Candidatus Binatia bacterium]
MDRDHNDFEQALQCAASLARTDEARSVVRIQGLRGGARSFFLRQLACLQSQPILVVTETPAAAEALYDELSWWLGEAETKTPLERRVHVFPAYDVPPLEELSPTPEVVAQRVHALYQLLHGRAPVLIAPVEALLQKVPPRERMRERWKYLVARDEVDRDALARDLVRWGYRRVELVEDRGDLALRGAVVDVYPPAYALPIRIYLDGDSIQELHQFDPVTQRSLGPLDELLLLPMREFDHDAVFDPAVIRAVEERAFSLEVAREERVRLVAGLESGIPFPGIERLLPLAYGGELDPVASYLPDDVLVCFDGPAAVEVAVEAAAEDIRKRAQAKLDAQQFFLPPELLYLTAKEWRELFASRPRLEIEGLELLLPAGDEPLMTVACHSVREARVERVAGRREVSFAPVAARLRDWLREGYKILLVSQQSVQASRLRSLLENHGLAVAQVASVEEALSRPRSAELLLVFGHLATGFRLAASKLVVLSEADLLGSERQRRRSQRLDIGQLLRNLSELKPGDYVVHVDFGVARYRGLAHLNINGTANDYLHLEYAGNDSLYIPVDRITVLQKYVGADGSAPPLDRLGSTRWARVKQKTKESILAMAKELIDIYAHREAMERNPYPAPDAYYREFEAAFPFEETEDQLRAIEDVLADMQKPKPMDRLVCGDVGFGKTEVAMRAAFLAVMDGRQVAVLVPTTVLAQQHLHTFRKRFEGYPVRIEMVSRFHSAKENAAIVSALKEGTVDIVIGTHRLLQNDVEFRRLGLLIIDEEHRFGVRHKEKIKQMRKLVDCLTLTATPIPRTLQMAFLGIRDLSVIETPPVDRLAVRTYVTRYDEHVIREALLREKARGGQAFFVHNRVDSIEIRARQLRQLVPECSFVVAHGQMPERELERVMTDFVEGRFDVLVCSAIIESGLDIPTANTIIIDRADHFGLAQLYQLRGRVGRSHERAFAYLLIPGEQLITREAQLRLKALQELDDLGGGFRLATSDLEIRGAGNLLGKEQSGQIAAVGFELYQQMLAEAVQELRGEVVEYEVEPEMHLGISAFIPATYVPDEHQRVVLYRRLAQARTAAELDALAAELRDRFGPIPPPVDSLLRVMDLRRILKLHKVERLKVSGPQVTLQFHHQANVDVQRLIALVRSGKGRFAIPADFQLRFDAEARDSDGLLAEIADVVLRVSGRIGETQEASYA